MRTNTNAYNTKEWNVNEANDVEYFQLQTENWKIIKCNCTTVQCGQELACNNLKIINGAQSRQRWG